MTDSQANSKSQSLFAGSNVQAEGLAEDASRDLAIVIAQAASDRKAGDIVILRVVDVSYMADYFVIVTGYSRVQVRAIAQAIAERVEEQLGRRALRTEGQADATWVLQDYGDAIVHIMMPKEREFYNLEAFWSHAERIEVPATAGNGG